MQFVVVTTLRCDCATLGKYLQLTFSVAPFEPEPDCSHIFFPMLIVRRDRFITSEYLMSSGLELDSIGKF